MKKLLATLMALCLVFSAPLVGLATGDGTAQGGKIVLTVEAAVSSSEFDAETQAMIDSVMAYVGECSLEMLATAQDDQVYLRVSLENAGKTLGYMDMVIDAGDEMVYIASDLLPAGWLSFTMEQLMELSDTSMSDLDFSGMDFMGEEQEGVMLSLLAMVEQISVATEAWVADHPDTVQEMPLDQAPEGMDPATDWTRLLITSDMMPAILTAANEGLKAEAEQGGLYDLTGEVIPADGYDQSAMNEIMGQMIGAYEYTEIDGVVDVITDEEGGMPGFGVDMLIDEDNIVYMDLLRQTDATGARTWNGSFQFGELDYSEFVGTLSASKSAPDDLQQRYDAGFTGDVMSYDYSAGTIAKAGTIAANAFAEHPGDGTYLPMSAGLDLAVNAEDEGSFDLNLGYSADHATEASKTGGDTDVYAKLSMDLRFKESYSDTDVSVSGTLGVHFTEISKPVAIPSVSGAVNLMELDEEAQAEYEMKATTAMQMWMITFISSLPSDLMQMVVNGGMM